MTKAELIERIKAQLAIDPATSHIHENKVIGHVLDALGAVAGEALPHGGELPLPGIGKLKGKLRRARPGRNPRTGEPILIPGHMGVKFEAGKALTDALKAVRT